jgi:vesicle coat complex subunit
MIIKLTDLVKYFVHKNSQEIVKKHHNRYKQDIKLFEKRNLEDEYQKKSRKK